MFLRNSWYAAAWDHELDREPLARMFLDEPVVLYRREDGTPVALEDRCCHRGLPLSMGTVMQDLLQCGYHGLRFDAEGTCVGVPGQQKIPPGAGVKSYPVVQRHQWIWIWMGESALADESLLPDWWQMDHSDWAVVKGDPPFYIRCNYELINDNLLDLSHVAFVHDGSIGTRAIADFPITTEREESIVRMSRWVLDSPAPPLYQDLGQLTGNVDRWQIAEANLPSFNTVHVGCVTPGGGIQAAADGEGIEIFNFNAVTPETENTTHYFYAHARGFRQDDADVDNSFRKDFRRVFSEDVDILGAQQKNIDRFPWRDWIDINVDGPGLQFRTMLRERIDAENSIEQGPRARE